MINYPANNSKYAEKIVHLSNCLQPSAKTDALSELSHLEGNLKKEKISGQPAGGVITYLEHL